MRTMTPFNLTASNMENKFYNINTIKLCLRIEKRSKLTKNYLTNINP